VGPGPDQFAQLALGLVKAGMRARTPQAPNTAGASLGMRQSADHPAGQRVWLAGSSHSVHVILEGGHEIAVDAPDQVAAEVEKVIALARMSR
jgi:hypothetical protein